MFIYQGRVRDNGSNFNGTGRFKFALVTGTDPTFVTYWSNDGTSANGSEPTAAVSAAVTNGLFTVVLGDSSVAHMTVIDASVFARPNLELRIWFDDGVQGSTALSPVQNLTPAPYAISALNLAGVVQNNVIGVGESATVGGGSGNISSNSFTTVGGGYHNISTGYAAAIGGGYDNVSSNTYTTGAGGFQNNAGAYGTTVSGGYANNSSGPFATVGGGTQNSATG